MPSDLAAAWDARVDRGREKLPPRIRAWVDWLRDPGRRPIRLGAALLLILGGIFSILPVLGLWMLPLGLAFLSQDLPLIKAPLEVSSRWVERAWTGLRTRFRRA